MNFAIAERPIHFPGDALPGFGVFEFLLGGCFGFLVRRRSDFVLVDEGADFAAGVFEGIAKSGALIVEEHDLFGDLVVLGFGGFFGGVNFCEENFVVGGGVHRVFVCLLDFDFFLQVGGIGSGEASLICAPGLQAVEFDVEGPGYGEHQEH